MKLIKNILISKRIYNQNIHVSSNKFLTRQIYFPGEGLDDEDKDYEDEEEGDDDDDEEDEEEEASSPTNAPPGGKQGDDTNECKQQQNYINCDIIDVKKQKKSIVRALQYATTH